MPMYGKGANEKGGCLNIAHRHSSVSRAPAWSHTVITSTVGPPFGPFAFEFECEQLNGNSVNFGK